MNTSKQLQRPATTCPPALICLQVAWSADSRLFVSGSKDSTLKVSAPQALGGRSRGCAEAAPAPSAHVRTCLGVSRCRATGVGPAEQEAADGPARPCRRGVQVRERCLQRLAEAPAAHPVGAQAESAGSQPRGFFRVPAQPCCWSVSAHNLPVAWTGAPTAAPWPAAARIRS